MPRGLSSIEISQLWTVVPYPIWNSIFARAFAGAPAAAAAPRIPNTVQCGRASSVEVKIEHDAPGRGFRPAGVQWSSGHFAMIMSTYSLSAVDGGSGAPTGRFGSSAGLGGLGGLRLPVLTVSSPYVGSSVPSART